MSIEDLIIDWRRYAAVKKDSGDREYACAYEQCASELERYNLAHKPLFEAMTDRIATMEKLTHCDKAAHTDLNVRLKS